MANDIFVIVITILIGVPLIYTNILTFKNKLKNHYMSIIITDFLFIIYIIAFIVAACRIFSRL